MKPRQPLPVELLATPDQRRLAEALDTAPPISATQAEDCNACRRKLNLNPVEMPPTNCRSAKEIGNVLSILDELQLRKETH